MQILEASPASRAAILCFLAQLGDRTFPVIAVLAAWCPLGGIRIGADRSLHLTLVLIGSTIALTVRTILTQGSGVVGVLAAPITLALLAAKAIVELRWTDTRKPWQPWLSSWQSEGSVQAHGRDTEAFAESRTFEVGGRGGELGGSGGFLGSFRPYDPATAAPLPSRPRPARGPAALPALPAWAQAPSWAPAPSWAAAGSCGSSAGDAGAGSGANISREQALPVRSPFAEATAADGWGYGTLLPPSVMVPRVEDWWPLAMAFLVPFAAVLASKADDEALERALRAGHPLGAGPGLGAAFGLGCSASLAVLAGYLLERQLSDRRLTLVVALALGALCLSSTSQALFYFASSAAGVASPVMSLLANLHRLTAMAPGMGRHGGFSR